MSLLAEWLHARVVLDDFPSSCGVSNPEPTVHTRTLLWRFGFTTTLFLKSRRPFLFIVSPHLYSTMPCVSFFLWSIRCFFLT